jgi:SAM-dependent methyltransferase
MYFFVKLTKLISRKNLYKLIQQEIDFIVTQKKNIKVLNIGSGGDIENFIKKNKNLKLISMDISKKRKPDVIYDISKNDVQDKIKFKPDVVTIFEVLEHVKNPDKAVQNIYKILKKNDICLCSVPFNFHIHDEPNDFYRFTHYGLKYLFRNYKDVVIKRRNGWLESIFVNFIRLFYEKNYFSKLLGLGFAILYFILYPLIIILQKIFISDKLTTGYFVKATK